MKSTISSSSLDAMAKFARSLAIDGRDFHTKDLVPTARGLAEEMDLTEDDFVEDDDAPLGFRLSFPACIAIATGSWSVPTGRAAHASKVLKLIDSNPGKKALDSFKHPRGNSVRRALHCWVPALQSGTLPRWPTFDELWSSYDSLVRTGDNYSWGILIPVKVYAILAGKAQGFTDAHCNRFAVPLGRAVQRGMEVRLGAAPGESSKAHRDALATHQHLARLSKSNVFDINSGFWVAGDGGDD